MWKLFMQLNIKMTFVCVLVFSSSSVIRWKRIKIHTVCQIQHHKLIIIISFVFIYTKLLLPFPLYFFFHVETKRQQSTVSIFKCDISMAKAAPRHNSSNELQTNEWVSFSIPLSCFIPFFYFSIISLLLDVDELHEDG